MSNPTSQGAWKVAQTVYQLFHALDDGRFEDAAALFAPEGVWVRRGAELIGPQQVLAALQARPNLLATRHLVSNLLAEGDEAAHRVRYYVTVFVDEKAAKRPAQLQAPQSMMVCEDELIAFGADWKFVRRTPSLVFEAQ